MKTKIIDGKKIAQGLRTQIADDAKAFMIKNKRMRMPCLAVVLVGEHAPSLIYVNNKKKACEEAGFAFIFKKLPADVAQEILNQEVVKLNKNQDIDGIIIQMPLPRHLNSDEVIGLISPQKDVDGLTTFNAGRLTIGQLGHFPCTALGILHILKTEGIDLSGKHAVVVGRSMLVGKPAAMLLLAENATVTLCHSKTQNLKEFTKKADILVLATGQRGLLRKNMVKKGVVIIDVSINKDEKGRLCGDADFNELQGIAGAITPVPGGVGPMTIAFLLKNTFEAYKGEPDAYI